MTFSMFIIVDEMSDIFAIAAIEDTFPAPTSMKSNMVRW